MLKPCFDSGDVDKTIRWIPAHKKEEEAHKWKDPRGENLSAIDVRANAIVDKLAKEAVEEHRVPKATRDLVRGRQAVLRMVAYTVGLTASCANNPKGGEDAIRSHGSW